MNPTTTASYKLVPTEAIQKIYNTYCSLFAQRERFESLFKKMEYTTRLMVMLVMVNALWCVGINALSPRGNGKYSVEVIINFVF